MKSELRRVGKTQSPVVVIDDFSGSAEDVARIADGLAPFPPIQRNFYPGVRRMITPADGPACAYVIRTCEAASRILTEAFGVRRLQLTEASFSIVAVQPGELQAPQRVPHFDSPDQNVFAMLHFLRVPEGTGTAFYRHRSTGIERVTKENFNQFVAALQADQAKLAPDSGYMNGSNEYFEQIGMVEAAPDRMLIYHGSLLHSGVIPPGMLLTEDPREGRLTANLFLLGGN